MISAIILAAGKSIRMGQPKMLLPWGKTTVLGHVMLTFREAGIEDLIVVTGGTREDVEQAVLQHGGRSAFNPEFARGEMLSSLQVGIRAQKHEAQATLVGLGDQPQVQAETVRLICEAFKTERSQLIVPSFQMHRGHPWLVQRSLWNEILEMHADKSPRDFLNQHAREIEYVTVNTSSILADLDTLEDYQQARPQTK
jgi:molybdenum cofactor cytidylyltransferase